MQMQVQIQRDQTTMYPIQRSDKARRLLVVDENDLDNSMSSVLRKLIAASGLTVKEVAEQTGIPVATLYSMTGRRSNRADVRLLKKLATFFGVEMEIFCGIEEYREKPKLTKEQIWLLESFEKLKPAAQQRLKGSIEDMLGNPKNIKDPPLEDSKSQESQGKTKSLGKT